MVPETEVPLLAMALRRTSSFRILASSRMLIAVTIFEIRTTSIEHELRAPTKSRRETLELRLTQQQIVPQQDDHGYGQNATPQMKPRVPSVNPSVWMYVPANTKTRISSKETPDYIHECTAGPLGRTIRPTVRLTVSKQCIAGGAKYLHPTLGIRNSPGD